MQLMWFEYFLHLVSLTVKWPSEYFRLKVGNDPRFRQYRFVLSKFQSNQERYTTQILCT